MTREIQKAVILGAGNLAWHLGHRLHENGISVVQVYNRSAINGSSLASSLKTDFTMDPRNLEKHADLYVITVTDDAVESLAHKINIPDSGLLVHTAGGVGMDVLSGTAGNFGVLYPLQTFTKDRPLDFKQIPLLIEANNPRDLGRLKQMAMVLSQHVYEVCSEDRQILHLAAVISSNFSNNMIACAERILKDRRLSLELLEPLMHETVAKAFAVSPGKAQTGPAVRGNMKIMEKHIAMLDAYPEIKEIYRLISKNIMDFHTDDKNKEQRTKMIL